MRIQRGFMWFAWTPIWDKIIPFLWGISSKISINYQKIMYNFQIETSFVNLNPLARNPGSAPASTIYFILFTWASPYGTHMEPGCTAHMGPIRMPTWDPYGSHIDYLLGFSNARFLRSPSVPGGVSIFFCMRRLEPSIYLSPPKISGISSTQIFLPEPTYIWKYQSTPPPPPPPPPRECSCIVIPGAPMSQIKLAWWK